MNYMHVLVHACMHTNIHLFMNNNLSSLNNLDYKKVSLLQIDESFLSSGLQSLLLGTL